jgi:hypothetical protein
MSNSNRKKSTAVAQYPSPVNAASTSSAYDGEIVEAHVVTAEDYFGNYDEDHEKKRMANDHYNHYNNGNSGGNNNNGNNNYSNGNNNGGNGNGNYSNGNSYDAFDSQQTYHSSNQQQQQQPSSARRASTLSSVPSSSSSTASMNGSNSGRRASAAVSSSSAYAGSGPGFTQASAEISTPVETSSYAFKNWPLKLRQAIINTFSRPMNERAGREFMRNNKWPDGLQSGLIRSCTKFPMRYFIVDDSGSMSTNDGRRVAGSGPQSK